SASPAATSMRFSVASAQTPATPSPLAAASSRFTSAFASARASSISLRTSAIDCCTACLTSSPLGAAESGRDRAWFMVAASLEVRLGPAQGKSAHAVDDDRVGGGRLGGALAESDGVERGLPDAVQAEQLLDGPVADGAGRRGGQVVGRGGQEQILRDVAGLH